MLFTISAKIIWADEIKNIAETSSTSQYFRQPKFFTLPEQTKSTTYYTEYKYFLSFAMCICEGEIKEITRIWNGNEIIDIGQYKFRLYKGSLSQMPDPLIQAKMNMQAYYFPFMSSIKNINNRKFRYTNNYRIK